MQIAHIQYDGGGLIVPANDPYSRQVLVEYVLRTALSKQSVKVLVAGKVWKAKLANRDQPIDCVNCRRSMNKVVCHVINDEHTRHCVACAFGGD